MAIALELDNFGDLLVIQQMMKGFFSNDSHLLQAVIAGDVASWQKFVLKYANVIYRAIDKYCDDYDEKMAVFLHILEKLRENRFSRLSRFEGKAKLSTWLTVVSRRLALDFLRAKYGRDFRLKKIRVVSYDAVPSFLKHLADTLTPEHEMAGAEQRQAREKLEHGAAAGAAKLVGPGKPGHPIGLFQRFENKGSGKTSAGALHLQVRCPDPGKNQDVKWKASLNSAGPMSRLHWGRKPMNDHIRGEDLAAYVDGLLSAEKKSELESHFSRCPACLDELAEIAAIMAAQAGGQNSSPIFEAGPGRKKQEYQACLAPAPGF